MVCRSLNLGGGESSFARTWVLHAGLGILLDFEERTIPPVSLYRTGVDDCSAWEDFPCMVVGGRRIAGKIQPTSDSLKNG